MVNITFAAREEVIDTNNLVSLLEQPVNQVRADKPSAARYKNTFVAIVKSGQLISLFVYFDCAAFACSMISRRIV